jgi:hypothetical protein
METPVALRRFIGERRVLHTARKGRFIEVVLAPLAPGESREKKIMTFDEYERTVEKRVTSDPVDPGSPPRSSDL